jgi:hypothetical protein
MRLLHDCISINIDYNVVAMLIVAHYRIFVWGEIQECKYIYDGDSKHSFLNLS